MEKKALVKLLKTLSRGRENATRDLLAGLGVNEYGHKLLLKAQKKGTRNTKVFDKLVSDGMKIVMIANEIGV